MKTSIIFIISLLVTTLVIYIIGINFDSANFDYSPVVLSLVYSFLLNCTVFFAIKFYKLF